MSLRGLKAQLARLKARAERRDAPTSDRCLAATKRETARRLRGAYDRLARVPGSGPPTPQLGRKSRELLVGDTPEQAEADWRVVQAWERAHGKADIKGAADEARARLLVRRE